MNVKSSCYSGFWGIDETQAAVYELFINHTACTVCWLNHIGKPLHQLPASLPADRKPTAFISFLISDSTAPQLSLITSFCRGRKWNTLIQNVLYPPQRLSRCLRVRVVGWTSVRQAALYSRCVWVVTHVSIRQGVVRADWLGHRVSLANQKPLRWPLRDTGHTETAVSKQHPPSIR